MERKTWEETKKIGRRARKPGNSTWIFGSFEPHLHKTGQDVEFGQHSYHLKGAERLEHVAHDEEDVADAQGAEEPVEEGRHRPEC